MNTLGIIPARYASKRFPGKVLAGIGGKSMLRRVYDQAHKSKLSRLVIATDDNRIKDHAESFGARVMMTDPAHSTGTERCAEAASLLGETFDVIINIQGDEPFLNPDDVNSLLQAFSEEKVEIATLCKAITDQHELLSPDTVKVIPDHESRAIYFSRTAIPYLRDVNIPEWTGTYDFYKHLGIYAYRGNILRQLTGLPGSALEHAEALEQLRWLYFGYDIRLVVTTFEGISVDTPADLGRANSFLERHPEMK